MRYENAILCSRNGGIDFERSCKSLKNQALFGNGLERFRLRKGLTHPDVGSILAPLKNREREQIAQSPSGRSHPIKIRIFSLDVEDQSMWDTCAVDLRVNLPRTVAAEVEEVQRNDPEMLSRIVYYAVMRRTIFEHLTTRSRVGSEVLTSRSETSR